MKKLFFLAFHSLTISIALAQGFTNPVISGFHPDPSVCRVGEDYYLVNSSNSYFPGIPIFHSKDLIHWEQIGHCLTRESQIPLGMANLSAGIWAPTIRYNKGTFYVISTNMDAGGHFIVTSKNPAGPWSEPIWIEKNGIDPSLFFDEDGKCYFTRNGDDDEGRKGIILYEINPSNGKKLSKTSLIHKGVFDPHVEGPHIYKTGDFYYLLMAEGGTHIGHMMTIARSKTLKGPYQNCPDNPILTHREKLFEHIQGVGHGDFVQDHKGSWWVVFLGFRNHWGFPAKHNLGRETFLAPVTWKNNWPVINGGNPIKEQMDIPTLPQVILEKKPIRDEFSEQKLNFTWNFIRDPSIEEWSLTDKKGWLTLKGTQVTLDSILSPAFIGRRQQHHWSRFSTMIDFAPISDNEESGLTIYASEKYHFDFFIRLVNDKRSLMIRRVVDDINYIAKTIMLEEGPVKIEIHSNPWAYEYFYSQGDKQVEKIFQTQSKLLTTEVAGGFVGNYYGLYATGNGKTSKTHAFFDWVEYGEFK